MERPHLRYIDAGPMAPTVSIAAATAPARALGAIGSALEGLGERGFQIAEQIRETDEAGKLSTWRSNADARANEFSNGLMSRQDPQNWTGEWETLREEIGAEIETLGLSPVATQRAKLEFDEWAGSTGNRFSTQAAVRTVSEGKARWSNAVNYYASRGDADGMRREIDRGAAFIPPSELEEVGREAERIGAMKQTRDDIAMDPAGMRELLDDPDYISGRPGMTEADRLNLQSEAAAAYREQVYAVTERVQNGIVTGDIRSPEDIEKLASGLPPIAQERLKADLATRHDAQTKAMRATPGYQASTVARVDEMLATYTVDSEGYDAAYVEMDSLVRTLPAGAVKEELSRRLSESRAGQVRELETAADFHRQALADLTRQGAFGTGTVQKPVAQILADGLLRDPAKLQARGFTPEQAAQIATAETEPQRIQLFRDLSKERAGFDQNSPYERAAFDAVLTGKTGLVEVEDLAAREKARRAAGLAKTKLEQWLKANPTATEEAGRQKLLEITGETAIPGAVESILARPPSMFGIEVDDGSVLPPLPDN